MHASSITRFSRSLTLLTIAACTTAGIVLAQPTRGAAPQPAREATTLPQFTLFVYEPAARMADRTDPAQSAAYWGPFAQYGQQLAAAGVMVGGSAVEEPSKGRRVQIRDAKSEVTPAAPGADGIVLGGYIIIQAPDLAAAVEWARKCPAALDGYIEVRPNVPMNPASNSDKNTR